MSLLLLMDSSPPGADIEFNGQMLAMPYSLSRLGFTYTRNSPKTVYQNSALVTLSANQFGTSYDAVTGLYGYTAEPAATNLATNSAGAAATWAVSNVSDAGTTITGFAASLAFGDNSVQRSATKAISVTSGTTYSISVFVEMDDASAPTVGATNSTGDVSIALNGVIATANLLVRRIGPASNLYRISGSIVASATASHAAGLIKYTGQSAKSFRIAGIQVETGARATSYIATAGATAARAADVLTCLTANIPGFSAAGYTIFTDSRFDVPFFSSTAGRRASIDDGTANNAASITVNAIAQNSLGAVSGGVTVASIPLSVGTARTKFAASYAADAFYASADGVAGTPDTSGAMPVSPTHFRIGCRYDNAAQCNHMIFRIRLIPVALNQVQTTALTV